MITMKKCPYCGFENEEQTEVCIRCKAGIPKDETNKTEEPEKAPKKRTRSDN